MQGKRVTVASSAGLWRRGLFSASSPDRGSARRQQASGRTHQLVVELVDQRGALHSPIQLGVRGDRSDALGLTGEPPVPIGVGQQPRGSS